MQPGKPTQERASAAVRYGVPLFIFALVCICFSPVLHNDFVNWDDPFFFAGNPNYRGLTAAHLRWMFTTRYMGHYQPLTWLSHALVYTYWGLNPTGYHLGNLLLHAANAVVLYFVIVVLLEQAALSGRLARDPLALRVAAAVGALLFALHPLRVEAVAWATERGEVLGALFVLFAVLAYLRKQEAARGGGRVQAWYVLSVGCFALSLTCKAAGIMLPIVLLVLDVYPLRRFAAPAPPAARIAALVEKLPYAVVAAGAAAVLIIARQREAMTTLAEHGAAARTMQAMYGLCFYLWKSVLPSGLSPLYLLHKPLNPLAPRYVLSALLVIAITLAAIGLRRRQPWVLAAWAVYAITAAPVLGFTQAGPQLVADRYSYLPCLPIAVLAAAGVYRLWLAWEARRVGAVTMVMVAATIVALLAVLGIRSAAQTRVWKDSLMLWNRALQIEPDNYYAYDNRGHARHENGDINGALADYDRAIQLNPAYANAYNNRGTARRMTDDFGGALADYDQALRFNPRYTEAYFNRANTRKDLGDIDGALADYDHAIALDPGYANAYNNRGRLRQARGDLNGALADYTQALRLNPEQANAYNNRGSVRQIQGDLPGAIADFSTAVRLAHRGTAQQAMFARNLAAARRLLEPQNR